MNKKDGSLKMLTVGLTLFLIFHYCIISLHAGPINPISLKYRSFTDKYVYWLFQQNWHLFAPEPMAHNNKFYVRVKYKENSMRQAVESEWFDISAPMLIKNDHSSLSPNNRLVRVHTGYIHNLSIGGMDDLTYKIINKSEQNKEDLSGLQNDVTIERAEEALYRYASSFVKRIFPDKELLAVQFKLGVIDAIPYSNRNDKDYINSEIQTTYEWRDINNDVVPLP